MEFKEIVLTLLRSVSYGTQEQAINSPRFWPAPEKVLYVSDPKLYDDCMEYIYQLDDKISSRFSRKKIHKHVESKLPILKKSGEDSIPTFDVFFNDFLSKKPSKLTIRSPISGIRLENEIREFYLCGYKFGYMKDLLIPMSSEDGMFISVDIENVYDDDIAIFKAEAAFIDFIRLIVFISGKLDKSIYISLGLPLSPNISHEKMYVSTSSYQVTDANDVLFSGNFANRYVTKVPVNDGFFSNNESFKKLWSLLEKKNNNKKMNDLESRLLNSALALGESSFTKDKRNSIIYTCMSVEIMFSFDEVGFFQRSIGEKLSDIFVFIVATDKATRIEFAKIFKRVYRMRSAIVHGGDKELTDENLLINYLMRGAITELLNKEKFQKTNNISQVYEMLRDAQVSY